MDLFYPNNAEDAERIRAVILSDDDITDDGTESDGDYVEPREGDPANAGHATSDDYSCTDNYVHWKEHGEVGKVKISAHIQCRWQNILTKLPEVMGQTRKATTSFERWNCLITEEISDNIVQHTNLYILVIYPSFSSESHAKRRDKIEIKGFIGLLCLAGALRNNNQSLEEL